MSLLPTDRAERKAIPLYSGVLAYFPSALVKVAQRSKEGNDEHNPGEPLHWSRDKSADHLDCVARHLTEGDLVGVAWRALAALQLECEANGAPMAPGARAAEWARANSSVIDKEPYSRPPNCDGQELILPLVRNADGSLSCSGTEAFARDDEATGL